MLNLRLLKSWKIRLCSLLNWAFLLIKVIMKNWVVFRGKKCGAHLELEFGEVATWWCHKLVEVNWRLKAFREVGNMKNDEFGLFLDLQVFYFIMWTQTQTHCQLLTFLNMLTYFVLPIRQLFFFFELFFQQSYCWVLIEVTGFFFFFLTICNQEVFGFSLSQCNVWTRITL